jgi:GT2 family glycosyltransferase/spore maturation protein CgeB
MTHLKIGNIAVKNKKYDEALEEYQRACDRMPELASLIKFNIELIRKRQQAQRRVEQQVYSQALAVTQPDPSLASSGAVGDVVRQPAQLAIIVLSLNGASLLDRLLRSLHENRPTTSFEVCVTDHASVDNTKPILDYWAQFLPLHVYYASENHSFSFSNNRWAEKKSGCKYFLFLNNDIVFNRNIIDQMVGVLSNPAVGVVGCDQLDESKMHTKSPWHHLGISFNYDHEYKFWRPANIQDERDVVRQPSGYQTFWAVTGSVLLVRRNDFFAVGGFDEGYFYGYEDVDFCLNVQRKLNLVSVSLSTRDVVHADGASRRKITAKALGEQRRKNIKRFSNKHTETLSRLHRSCLIQSDVSVNRKPKLVFAVTEVGHDAAAGDFFTARELGAALIEEFAWEIEFRPAGKGWYELDGVDIVVAMVDAYNPREICRSHPGLVKIAWARNWFDRWCHQEWHDEYDMYFASSKASAEYICSKLGHHPKILRIATNPERFWRKRREVSRKLDFVFTGSFWNANREVVSALSRLNKNWSGAVYGKNWGKVPELAHLYRGFLPYDQLNRVYQDSKIVIDDANHVTKPWGSVNSRVFDAIASGCLVITNSRSASDDAFDGELPSYSSPEELCSMMGFFLENPTARQELVERLQQRVLGSHTYTQRAYEFAGQLRQHIAFALRIAIKIPVPRRAEAQNWGDFHFATALACEIRRKGHSARIDFLPEWDRGAVEGDTATLVLRGLSEYRPAATTLNYIWLISHPDKVSIKELSSYDRVFIASDAYARDVQRQLRNPAIALLQCTDPNRFNPLAKLNKAEDSNSILFVGNTRGQFRKIVKDAITAGVRPTIFGSGWERFVPKDVIRGNNLPNALLASYYANAKVVLNDHWDDMAKHGFLSNRLFDAVASGATIISDNCIGLNEKFGKSVATYETAEDLRVLIDVAAGLGGLRDNYKTTVRVRNRDTFERRAESILSLINMDLSYRR